MNSNFQDYKISISQYGDVIIQPFNGKYQYCLFFIHGLSCEPNLYLKLFLTEPLKSATKNFKIVIPRAPLRKVTVDNNRESISWFDIKVFQDAFSKPFDQVFSAEEVQDSFKMLKNLIDQEAKQLNGDYSKIFLSGFSQGCGMSIYTAYGIPQGVAGVVGIAGYYLEITNYSKQKNIPILNIHGLCDQKRVWSDIKRSYDKFQGSDKVKLVQDMAHEVYNVDAQQLFADFLIKHSRL